MIINFSGILGRIQDCPGKLEPLVALTTRAGGRKWGTVAILPFLFHTVSPSKLGCVLILTGEKKRRKKKLIPTWSKVLGFFLPSSSSWRFIKYWYWMLIIFFPKGVIKIELLFRTLP